MSRKHYEAFAQEIRRIQNLDARYATFCAVASVCECYNPRFDRRTFALACGMYVPQLWNVN